MVKEGGGERRKVEGLVSSVDEVDGGGGEEGRRGEVARAVSLRSSLSTTGREATTTTSTTKDTKLSITPGFVGATRYRELGRRKRKG